MSYTYNQMAEKFFDRTYQDASTLLYKAREYVRLQAFYDLEPLSPLLSLKVSSEILRITARLTQIMACLLAQKAAYKGEITFEEAFSENFTLPQGALWTQNPENKTLEYFPLIVVTLLDESLTLYKRVSHLCHRKSKVIVD